MHYILEVQAGLSLSVRRRVNMCTSHYLDICQMLLKDMSWATEGGMCYA